tara:strand:- start:145 stop:561 length:417 start_codon:yes stop_codon:yes gene_type:complete
MELIGVMAQLGASQQAAKAHRQSGQAQAQAYRDQAEQAESKAKDEELIRLKSLRQALSSQRAHWAASGIDSSTGSPTTIRNVSQDNFQLDQGAALINTRQQVRSFNNSANAAIKIGNIKARGSLLSGVTSAANTYNSY